jgi:hypothetical protein
VAVALAALVLSGAFVYSALTDLGLSWGRFFHSMRVRKGRCAVVAAAASLWILGMMRACESELVCVAVRCRTRVMHHSSLNLLSRRTVKAPRQHSMSTGLEQQDSCIDADIPPVTVHQGLDAGKGRFSTFDVLCRCRAVAIAPPRRRSFGRNREATDSRCAHWQSNDAKLIQDPLGKCAYRRRCTTQRTGQKCRSLRGAGTPRAPLQRSTQCPLAYVP